MADRIRHADELINGLTNNAVRDPLTGLLNRTAFNDALGQEIARTRRYGGSFSLIILDFNNFTRVNRQVGREAGDEIIQWMGRLLTEHTRASDVPYRLGQDVFTILCPWTSGDYAEAVAGRLTVLVAEAKPPITVEGGLSLATGTATCPGDAQEAPALFHAAERALARSKVAAG
ncbi:MAG: GGDEF domain-containing protein [Gemmatimonadetes bacterium]|nr:GGDEF domain-containing protein [Gemmatimonadota bacterium]MDA1102753.1 GGDEF domain-containing protein [Gemmatimonadota bacterium]